MKTTKMKKSIQKLVRQIYQANTQGMQTYHNDRHVQSKIVSRNMQKITHHKVPKGWEAHQVKASDNPDISGFVAVKECCIYCIQQRAIRKILEFSHFNLNKSDSKHKVGI